MQAASLYALFSVAGVEKGMSDLRRVSGQVDKTQGALSNLERRTSGWSKNLVKGTGQVAQGLVRVGEKAAVAALVAGGAAAKISMDFEDAFAAVEKTVEGTPKQLADIDQALRKLSTTIPVTFQGLTSIASEAGALGVATKDVVKFTEAVARTSAATVGLSEFDASEAFGKLSTIFGLTGKEVANSTGKMVTDYERLGSALVALGNAGASSEADIIQVAKRFASVGQSADLSAAQVLGWSSALASLGPEAEAAGGALQRIFGRATRNIALMGEKGLVGENARDRVKVFAQVTGMSVDEFVKAYAADTNAAMIRVMQGLGGLDKFQLERSLFQMGIVNIRDINAVEAFTRRLPILTEQVQLANDAWKEGTELQAVSDKRFDTLKNQAIKFKNLILVGAAAFGDGLTPAIGRAIAKFTVFINDHMGELKDLGLQVGAAIDAIDWQKVGKGAETFVGWLREGRDILAKVPSDILAISAGFLAVNKLSGGLIGGGMAEIVKGLGKAAINIPLTLLASKGGAAGAAIGAATAQRVFVVNWPGGAFGGGPGALVPGAAAGGGLLAAGMTAAAWVAVFDGLRRLPGAFESMFRGLDAARKGDAGGYRRAVIDSLNNAEGWLPTVLANAIRDGMGISRPGSKNISGPMPHGGTTNELLAQIAANTSGSPDERDERNRAGRGTTRVTGDAIRLGKLGAIGSADDPFGFKHIKTFAYNNLGKNDPLGLRGELKWHIGETEKAITKAEAKGDTETAEKLRQTKAALESMLAQVKAGTYRAGDKAYEGALLVMGAVHATTAAIQGIPGAIRGLTAGGRLVYTGANPYNPNAPSVPANSSGSPDDRDAALVYASVPSKFGQKEYASGVSGIARSPHRAVFGEAGSEEVAIIRNPRAWDGAGGTMVDVKPFPVTFRIDGREVAAATVRSDVFTRRRY